jgi:hypothetical protein
MGRNRQLWGKIFNFAATAGRATSVNSSHVAYCAGFWMPVNGIAVTRSIGRRPKSARSRPRPPLPGTGGSAGGWSSACRACGQEIASVLEGALWHRNPVGAPSIPIVGPFRNCWDVGLKSVLRTKADMHLTLPKVRVSPRDVHCRDEGAHGCRCALGGCRSSCGVGEKSFARRR